MLTALFVHRPLSGKLRILAAWLGASSVTLCLQSIALHCILPHAKFIIWSTIYVTEK
jgi:hypothetical protein